MAEMGEALKGLALPAEDSPEAEAMAVAVAAAMRGRVAAELVMKEASRAAEGSEGGATACQTAVEDSAREGEATALVEVERDRVAVAREWARRAPAMAVVVGVGVVAVMAYAGVHVGLSG